MHPHHLGDAYRQLTLNFEFWVEFFCVPTCFHMRILKSCLSVPREKKLPYILQYQSYISNWYINGKVVTSSLSWEFKNLILIRKNALLSVSAVMFYKQCLAYAVHIDWCYQSIHKHTSRFQHNICVNYMHLYDDIVPSRVDI